MYGRRRVSVVFELKIKFDSLILSHLLVDTFKQSPRMRNHSCSDIVPSCSCWQNERGRPP
jgi:hypothetical protein